MISLRKRATWISRRVSLLLEKNRRFFRLQRSIYGLKQASRSCNMCFDEVIRGYGFIKNELDFCIYKTISGSSVVYLMLYVDDILLIGNDVKMLRDIKVWFSTQFFMKDMGLEEIQNGKLKTRIPSDEEGTLECAQDHTQVAEPVVIFCNNKGAIAQAKEPRSHHHFKYILRCYHLLREMVNNGDIRMGQVSSTENTVDPFTKPVSQVAHTQHLDKMGLRSMVIGFRSSGRLLR
ncbi:UNVERIFIED_CONTAM: Retrovirus-related Pol polyprotein from transposon TNT 1-94 [Sesamum angustifolium]|uniref:Retrovirus-related Pol polyprotein from transposon TNT 1-94 n=1 Tax=Sesamum angustifolium TaxID=2727405 RepID=A0AAW2MNJ7_9LAMI